MPLRPRAFWTTACALAFVASGARAQQPQAPAPAPPPAQPPAPAGAGPAQAPGAPAGGATAPAPAGADPAAPAAADPAAPAAADGAEGAEEMAVEEGTGEGLGDEMPKPDANNGVITGVVLDARSGEAIPDAQIVIAGTKHRAVADFEGNYGVKLPPGRYTVRVFFPGFKAKRIDNVAVVAGKASTVKVSLGGDEKAEQVEELVVETDAERTTAATQLLIRRKAATVSDAVSAQDIAKTPDRNAADAVRRIVGATVVDNRFVYVRGLGDRYNNTLLNGIPLPSPEPDTQAVPLDIFPVLVLSDLTVNKTFTPDMPADFAGGSVNIHTRPFPDKFIFSVSATAGFNSQATFNSRDSYKGSGTDWLGSDDGSRSLPSSYPRFRPVNAGPNGVPLSVEENAANSRAMPQGPARTFRTLTPPNGSLNFIVGDRFNLFKMPVGWLAAATYGRRFRVQEGETQATYRNDADAQISDYNYRGRRSIDSVTIGAVGGLSIQLDRNNRFSALGMLTRNSDDEVWSAEGSREQNNYLPQTVSRSRWVERDLRFGQFTGEHRVPALNALDLRYTLFAARAERNEPNNTQSAYTADPVSGQYIYDRDLGLSKFFAELRDKSYGGSIDVTQPLSRDTTGGPKLKAGALLQFKDREFLAKRYQFQTVRCADCSASYELPIDVLSRPEYVGRTLTVIENTQATDAYIADQKVIGGYLMGEWPLTKKLRLVGGERIEHANFSLTTRNPLLLTAPPVVTKLNDVDLMPSANVIYGATDNMNLRLAGSQTIARPQLRELAQFAYTDSLGAFRFIGNPDLERSKITNVDLRWEWFPSSEEVIAVSAYYKYFKDPIEFAIVGGEVEPTRTYANSKSANNFGAEFEARKNLSFLQPSMRAFTFIGNLTLTQSRVSLTDQQKRLEGREDSRPLQGQAPWVVNVALDYIGPVGTRARVNYYVFGKRLASVGQDPLPDVYELPRHTLDLTIAQNINRHLDIKFAAENVMNAVYNFKQGDRSTSRFQVGSNYWISLIYTL